MDSPFRDSLFRDSSSLGVPRVEVVDGIPECARAQRLALRAELKPSGPSYDSSSTALTWTFTSSVSKPPPL